MVPTEGLPTTRQEPCWTYALLPSSGAAALGATKVVVEVCFYEGRLSYTT